MRIKLVLLCLIFSCIINAQNGNTEQQTLLQAKNEYDIGHFDTAISFLENKDNLFHGKFKSEMYRLLSLCSIAKNEYQKAEEYVEMLLKYNPYYTISLQDPVKFADLIERCKTGRTTIMTASQQVETLNEAPVPVTLITEDMIKESGARNLRDLLALYVPGVSIVEGNNNNISMHGVYSASQEKVLIMLNGHRLNSRTTNEESVDYRNSLDKIKQIEVLRGPASSLYGNVALTAVVNIITKQGNDVDGFKVSYGMGDNSSYQGSVLFGKQYLSTDFLAWASVYSSKGETRTLKSTDNDYIGILPIDGTIQLEGYNSKPSYDIGFVANLDKFRFMFTQQYAKKVIPFTSAALHPTVYSYDKYRLYNGAKPGNGRLTNRGEISYADKINNISWNATAFIDIEQQQLYDVTGDTLIADDAYLNIGNLFDEYTKDSLLIQKTGVYQILNWEDLTYGVNLSTGIDYSSKKFGSGNLLIGAQFENYNMKYNSFLVGDKFERIDLEYSDNNQKILIGDEQNFSAFFQLKHRFSNKIIFNGGLRYDLKNRYNNKRLNAFSPRVSFIYNLNSIWNFKMGYSCSFVDAPYLYRTGTTISYKGAENLDAEYMKALQISTSADIAKYKLKYDCNLYYNELNNLIYSDTQDRIIKNAGNLKLFGIENVLSYRNTNFNVTANASYMKILGYENYVVRSNKIFDVPSFIANVVSSVKVLSLGKKNSFWLRGNVSFYSSQQSPIYVNKGSNESVISLDNKVDARAICNLGVVFNSKRLDLSVQCYNLLNTHYLQGASRLYYDVPQQGRSFMTKISYTL